ncbi:SDR family oxidoreductase [Flavobacterium psychroterrae]|uniref:SDR family oxidoreductase n=1 Tax=Flavobacterium psychroterrae TaxID=2133767 RepID=A0ABS5PHM5_9FLAO|nr:SDR family oxidoreductase [Flavobacterium psychroterrae]MBS7233784.1 SDR family oxidoreductase [Flavobacterium psychroterrae]
MKNTALITGASSGIGRELARIHAANKGDLIIVARTKEKLEILKDELQKKHGIKVLVITKDLTQRNAVQEIYQEVTALDIKVKYLINNAGFGGHGKFHERKWESDLQMIQVNILALTALTRYFLPGFVKRNDGKILNVSSTACFIPGPLQAVYYASKAYVTSFSYALSEELSDTAITVTALMPGATETEFAKTSGMDRTELFNKTAQPQEVALAGYNAMLDGKLDIVAGLTPMQKVMIAAIPFMPKKAMLKQVRKMQELNK